MTKETAIYFVDGPIQAADLPSQGLFVSDSDTTVSGVKTYRLDESSNSAINYKAFEEVVDFYNHNDQIFAQFKAKMGFDIWFYFHFRIYFEYRNFRLKEELLNQFISEYPQGKILSLDDAVLKAFPNQTIQPKVTASSSADKKGLSSIFKEVWRIFRSRKGNILNNSSSVVISNIVEDRGGNDRRFHALEDEYDKILIRAIFDTSRPSKSSGSNVQDLYSSDWILKDYIWTFKWLRGAITLRSGNRQLLKGLSNNLNGSASEKILKIFKAKINSVYIYQWIRKSFIHHFDKRAFRNVILSDENSPQIRAIMEAAQLSGLKTFAFQHGNIHDLHPAYIYSRYRIKPDLADITFTWGTAYTELLRSKGGYSAEKLFTSGRLIPLEPRSINEAIDQSKFIMLYATQPQRNTSLRLKQLMDVLSVAMTLGEGYQLVIRPHPAEVDDRYFNDAAIKVGCKNYLIDRKSGLADHFEMSDIMITSFSTVATEYLSHFKPLLILDYLEEDLAGYVKERVGIPIVSRENLLSVLSKKEIKFDKEAYSSYLKQFYSVSPDTVDVVKECINSYS